ncbi:hypothetical protein [Mycobacterium sp. IDR2000157661]|uniref:hypothetical protein n=1 Tax=Mycobacterium sp. IDR2000157661 TaxID=2867005 RepID=UPI001EEEB0AC|nr:hypothetical protein [Mycobacterium sp. IDR2000157661]ULE34956.1 hypothetical protein K3G64_10500 [Mycobacterium sp. IDR2000157661]
MKLTAAVALACGFVAAPLFTAANAPASPGYCDGADCIEYVDRTAVEGAFCRANTRYNFGIDAAGNTLACNSRNVWIASPPLVGIRTQRLPCGDASGVAQTPDGFPLSCIDGAWTQDFHVMFYG